MFKQKLQVWFAKFAPKIYILLYLLHFILPTLSRSMIISFIYFSSLLTNLLGFSCIPPKSVLHITLSDAKSNPVRPRNKAPSSPAWHLKAIMTYLLHIPRPHPGHSQLPTLCSAIRNCQKYPKHSSMPSSILFPKLALLFLLIFAQLSRFGSLSVFL